MIDTIKISHFVLTTVSRIFIAILIFASTIFFANVKVRRIAYILVFYIFAFLTNTVFAANFYNFRNDLPAPNNQVYPSGIEACEAYITFYNTTYPQNPPLSFVSYTQINSSKIPCYVTDGTYISTRNIFSTLGVNCQSYEEYNPANNTCSARTIPDRPKDLGESEDGCSSAYTGHPIHIATGNKYLKESDYISRAQSLALIRSYNSQRLATTAMGADWEINWLGYKITTVSSTEVYLNRPDGKMYPFTQSNGNWQSDADVTGTLEQLTDINANITGWRYTSPDGDVEIYNVAGQLTSLTNRSGWVWTITTTSTSTTITDPLNKQLRLAYSANRITQMSNPAGGGYTYTYSTDGNNNLKTVTYPDGKVITYHYGGEAGEDANVSPTPDAGVSYANALTGITDENGNRYATYRYDSAGRAYDEELALGLGTSSGQKIEHNNLAYNADGSGNPTTTVVTDPRGTVRTYNFTTILGVVKSTGTDQPAGSGCAASGSNLTYDANGNIATKTDFNGNKITYVYDMTRNLETSRTEGLTTAGAATAATRTITTTWHPTWRLPLVVSEYNGASATGTPLRTTTTVYDDKGNITSYSEADPVSNTARTTTTAYTYSTAVPGLTLIKVVDGPRTDVNDITTYNYYPHDATCTPSTATPIIDPVTNTSPDNLGCRGQLASITNALNQTTTYDRYNHHGQVEQMTDANGLITTSTYDLRQRLLSRTVGTETTTLTYDNVGQVTQLNLPDNSQLNYTYDAAHRLTDIQDSLGNKIHYTLDAEGNRINEDITDPTNQLTKTLTRSYDALNRLQQVTGIE